MIGSQALIADPRATVPSATARARVPARWSATPTTERPTTVVAPTAPSGPCADAGAVRLSNRAAREHDAQPGVRLLQPREVTLPADDLLLRPFTDRARVDHDQIG